MSDSIDDPTVLGGISTIVNKQNVDPNVNFEEIEKNMIDGGFIMNEENPSDEFKNELKDLSDKLGISLDDIDSDSAEANLLTTHSNVSINDYISHSTDDNHNSNDDHSNLFPNSVDYNSSNNDDDDYHSSEHNNDYTERESHNNDHESTNDKSDYKYSNSHSVYNPESNYSYDDDDSKTDEEERRSITQGVVSELSSESSSKIFSLEKERREHERGIKLEKIDELRRTLDSEKIDLTNVPVVNRNSKDEQIDYALKILILKNDRIRFHTVAEEVILLGAYTLEEIFDGKRVWLGKYKPDLVGWHTHVSSKLRRMRYDTSTLVSNVMSEYNIGSLGRIMLELVPNAFMYSRKKRRSKNSETLYTREQADAARSGIRDKDEIF